MWLTCLLHAPSQGIWGAHYPENRLGGLLNYTRTTMLVKQGAGRDYVVLRDRYVSPVAVTAVVNQFYMQDGTEVARVLNQTQRSITVDVGNSTLFVVLLNSSTETITNHSFVRWTNKSEGNEFATGTTTPVVFAVCSLAGSTCCLHAGGQHTVCDSVFAWWLYTRSNAPTDCSTR